MSTGLKIGIGVLVALGVIGAGVVGAQVATAQKAAVSSAQAGAYPFPGGMMQGWGGPAAGQYGNNQSVPGYQRGPMMGRFGNNQSVPGYQRGPMMGGRGYNGADADDQWGPGYGRGPMMGAYGWGGPQAGYGGYMMGGAWGAQYHDQMVAAMAKALGMTTDELIKAFSEGKSMLQIAQEKGVSVSDLHDKMAGAMADVLKQAVADGKLTQAQADVILEQVKLADTARDLVHGATAEALGITTDELDKALAEGKSPAQIAQDKGISQTDFQTKLADALDKALQQAVKDGKLTQAQADALLAHIKTGRGPGMMWSAGPAWGGTPQ